MATISIQAEGVRKRLGVNQALDEISTRFEPGTLHGLIGPDGAGKTTFLRILIGLLRPDQGAVRFFKDGQPARFEEIRPTMAYMPQQQSLYPDLSISEHLDFFRDLYQVPADVYKTRRKELLEITRLEKFIDRPAGKLSGGMYKKLGLMCALLQSPSVVLLDEPTNGVDPISRREFWELLHHLSGQRILILMATSYMDEAERCGQVHVFNAGRIMVSGEPRAILNKEGARNFDELFQKREGVTL
jgi:ABC-2 type transport system ATP-binding protein